MSIAELASRKNLLTLMAAAALVHVAAYYLAGALVNGPGPLAVAQPDTLLYCQAARRIADGHAFSFSTGTAVSTGTTSVLYPFVLAVPYLLGAQGDSLVTAGFALNAFFYLVFILAWGFAICRWFGEDRPGARLFAAALFVLAGQPAFCACAQSDIGIWLAVSGLFAAGLAADRPLLWGPVLLLAPWIRPEGLLCAVAVGCVGVFTRSKRDLSIAVLGILSAVGVCVFNSLLTGEAGFSSISNKGYFTNSGLAGGLYRSAADLMTLLKAFVFAQPASIPRDFYFVPGLAAVLLAAGIWAHDWKKPAASRLAVYLLAALAGIATVAQSGWQNTNLDRYLSWTLPPIILLSAEGAWALAEKLRTPGGRALALGVPLLHALGAAVALVTVFHLNTRTFAPVQKFGTALDAALAPGESVGACGVAGLVYMLGERRMAHLSGIYSPEFRAKSVPAALEILKREPQTRFDHWIFDADDPLAGILKPVLGDQTLVGPNGYAAYRADWSAFDRAAAEPGGGRLLARVDVGYEKDERAVDRTVLPRYGADPFEPLVSTEKNADGQAMLEVGSLVTGEDAMTVPLEPGRDTRVVMRVLPSVTAVSESALIRSRTKYEIANPASLQMEVDGVDAGTVTYTFATNGFSDVVFTIPGEAIRKTPCRVAFRGEHVVFGYWFYR